MPKPTPVYHQYDLTTSQELVPILIAFLGDAGFDSFEETDAGLSAFALSADHERWVRVLEGLRATYPFDYRFAELPEKNWNAVWESQFQPLSVADRLFIRADFHDPHPDISQELVITPKMAFGTGHHATTYMMCELLLEHPPAGVRVLDYGSGTGVLAILAARLGAGPVDAVDIEAPSAENTAENARRNDVTLRHIIHGTLDDVPDGPPYDLILANINRNVILATADTLYERLEPGGRALFSGILAKDESLLVHHLTQLGFRHLETRQREDWRAFVFTRL
nr:50S ribosomal protein L11 methyltransferase [Lewinella sp. W8]